MRMATYFLGLTVEQQRAYATKARAEAAAELKIAGISKVATRTAKAWRALQSSIIDHFVQEVGSITRRSRWRLGIPCGRENKIVREMFIMSWESEVKGDLIKRHSSHSTYWYLTGSVHG